MKQLLVVLIFPFVISAQDAFIAGNDTICSNGNMAQVSVSFSGVSPFTFVYAINGVSQSSITTEMNPYIIETQEAGNYFLTSYNDAISAGSVSGSGLVTVLESPTALIHLESDTLSIIYPTANFISQSIGNIVSWQWDFGDNLGTSIDMHPTYTYESQIQLYQVSLIVTDNKGCADTASKIVYVINHEEDDESYWMWVPNAFIPDKDPDKRNERFCIEYNGIQEETFLFKVFNSQGDLMYQSTNPSTMKCSNDGGWDGRHYLTNQDLPMDTYVYEMYYQEEKGWKHQEYRTIILVR